MAEGGVGVSAGIDLSGLFNRKQTGASISQPVFYNRPGQKRAFQQFTPRAIEDALSGGISSRERQGITTRAFEGIERGTQQGRESIMEALARTGISGGFAGREFGKLEAGRIGAQSQAQSSIEELIQNLKTQRISELLGLTSIGPAVGQYAISKQG